MRLFAAVLLPADVLTHVTARMDEVRQARRLRWVRVEQLHLTVAFYRDVPQARVEDLTERLRRAAHRCSPMDLEVGGAGTFGSARAARVLWIGVDGDVDALRRLAASARAAGRRVGLDDAGLAADHSYRPHLTIARADPPQDVRELLAALRDHPPLCWQARGAVLVRSELGRGAGGSARHTVVADLPFNDER